MPNDVPSVNFQFSFTQTIGAQKSFHIGAVLQHEMSRLARRVAETELKKISHFELSIVAMCDIELLEINQNSLGHDWLTDVITFEIERDKDSLEAEIYLSTERAVENAQQYNEPVDVELLRLVVHGVLHLAGYEDKTAAAKKRMRSREGLYLVPFQVPANLPAQEA